MCIIYYIFNSNCLIKSKINMKQIVDYKNIEGGKILVRTFSGNVNMQSIIANWDHVILLQILTSRHIGVISDFRGSNAKLELNDLNLLANYFNTKLEIFKDLKMAQIVDSPKIAYPTLFTNTYKEFSSRPFSTLGAATLWILGKESN